MKLSDIEVLVAAQRDISRRLDQLIFENEYDSGPHADAILNAYENSQRSAEQLIALAKEIK